MSDTYTMAGFTGDAASQVCALLQDRLNSLIDLSLTLKHVHWNVVGPQLGVVHELLDDHAARARAFVDETAERIATLGGEPQGTPGAVVAQRDWDDYRLGRADVQAHLAALDRVYQGIVADHRQAIEKLGDLDVVTQDLLIEQTKALETHQWLLRAHLAGGAEEGGGDRPPS